MPTPSPDAARLLRGGSRTFHAASLVLPRAVREPARELYAFCRLADDAVDGAEGAHDAVATLHRRLDSIYAGTPDAADAGFAAVVTQYAIPRDLPASLIEGFAWDAQGRRYHDLHDLHAYATRVAGSVGAMMALVMGSRSREALARACDLGIAMQLSNIARDVGEDARNRRVYLPLAWLRAEGIDPDEWLARPHHSPALARVVLRVLDEAARLYRSAGAGIAHLPAGCRAGIGLAARLYEEIGREVARRGGDSVASRAVVSPLRKSWVMADTLVRLTALRLPPPTPAVPAAHYLVDAAAQDHPPAQESARGFAARVAWTLDLFVEVERRQHARAG
ncbi:MAG: phytoene/squalene synthase family protein [Burkholderiales bacterium]